MDIALYRTFSFEQGSADAFIQAQINTGINPGDGRGWELLTLEVMINPSCTPQILSADCDLGYSLCRASQTAVVPLNDNDCLAADGVAISLTTNGQVVIPLRYEYDFVPGTVVVDPTLFFQFDSTATGVTFVGEARLYFRQVKITELEALRMLSQGA